VAPVPIELKLAANSSIELACVMGTGLPQPVALVVLNDSVRRKRELAELDDELKKLVASVNASLDSHERLMKLVVVEEPWNIENGLLTPTLKVKRNQIESRYAAALGNWISAREPVVWHNSMPGRN
jgi:long-subunit acyl-CoA synthetase (AMP-forming)